MQFPCTGGAGYFRDVARVEAAAGQYCDAIARLLNKVSESERASLRMGSAARSQDPMRAGGGDVFEGRGEIFRLIESTVERSFHGRGESNEFPGALLIHQPVQQQHSGDDALHVLSAKRRDFFLHQREFVWGVHEIPGAWTHQDVYGELYCRAHLANQLDVGRQSACFQVRAQFQAMGAGSLCRERPLERGDCNLQQKFLWHPVDGAAHSRCGKTAYRAITKPMAPPRTTSAGKWSLRVMREKEIAPASP